MELEGLHVFRDSDSPRQRGSKRRHRATWNGGTLLAARKRSNRGMHLIKPELPVASRVARLQPICRKWISLIIAMLMSSLAPVGAHARCGVSESGVPADSSLSTLWPRMETLGGTRSALARSGVQIGATYITEVLGNPSGGVKQSAHQDGLLNVYLDADMEKMIGWKGLCFHINGFQIQGTSISDENLLSIVSASDIEAFPSTRLDEFWFEQKMLNDKVSVRFGALAVDTEFLIADSAGAFIASTFGWTTISSDNLPYGGPIYPFASPGVRVAIAPNDDFKLMIDVNDDNPIGPCPDGLDPGQCNENGLEFRLDDPPLLLVEADYSYNKQARLAGTIKLGGWYDFGKFADQRLDVHGRLRGITGADPLLHDGTYAVYGVIDQLIYQLPGAEEGRGISVFARAVGSPADRNQVDAYFDTGIVFTGMLPRRPNDVFGIGFAYTGISADASAFDRDSGLSVIRNHEVVLEISYTAQLIPGWTLQPDFEYIRNPGGHLADDTGTQAIENATVLGVRTTISF
jgi:porin